MRKFAVIDLGSNSVRMNIVEVSEGNVTVTAELKETVRLSEGMGKEKTLKKPAIERALTVLKSFSDIIKQQEITEVYAIATAAVRQAKNRETIINPLKESGIDIKVISGEKEAYYDYLGVINSTSIKDCVIVDIGGASTEIILVRDGIHFGLASIPYGAVNITESFIKNDKANDSEISSATKKVKDELSKIYFLDNSKGLPIIGLGGSIRTLGKAERARRNKNNVELHNFEMSDNDFYALSKRIFETNLMQRREFEGISKSRAEVIIGGIIPLYVIFEMLNSTSLYISTSGLRDGVMYEKLNKNHFITIPSIGKQG